MRKGNWKLYFSCLAIALFIFSCSTPKDKEITVSYKSPDNVLDYSGDIESYKDRSSLAFSDQGAWFAYGFSKSKENKLGFTGPFLMTQGFGEWSSKMLSQLDLVNVETDKLIPLNDFSVSQKSYNSHLEQVYKSDELEIKQTLFYSSGHSAIITTQITNFSKSSISIQPNWKGEVFPTELKIGKENNTISLSTDRSTAKGIVQTFGEEINNVITTDTSYVIALNNIDIKPNETILLTLAQTFIFTEYDTNKEQSELKLAAKSSLEHLQKRIEEKEKELISLNSKLDTNWTDSVYQNLVSKTVLTLQNNTRIPAGELKYSGLFPSYHYKWFLGFWAWDSWKHAVALAHFKIDLAKDQVRAMYDFQLDNGFIVDCVYRDTTIDNHNYRNTKPPLSAWAIWNIYKQDGDVEFVKELYPKIVKQHNWWYEFRDFDKDGICEYGSTDGTLVAAKWESGMDNAVRFDSSEMVKSSETVYSLNQESVDLNSYLYAEKKFLLEMAKVLGLKDDVVLFEKDVSVLKERIQTQFYDQETGWFYDTSIDGEEFIQVMGCEGWIPLWAEVATKEQAETVKKNMMNPSYFNTKVPFQTLSASHPDFKPNRGYWRGPNWLDQAYFGVKGLHNYGYHDEAYKATYKLIHNAEGVLAKGASIRENYQPITGEGLESQNFSWSAAHYLLLLLNE